MVWPEATLLWSLWLYGRADGELQEGSHQGAPPRTGAASAPSPATSCYRPTPPQESLQHEQVGLFQSPVRSLLLSCGSWYMSDFVWTFQGWRLCFPLSCGSPTVKSCWPSRSDSLGIPRLGSLIWGQNLHNSGRTCWYYCSSVCGSPPSGYGI